MSISERLTPICYRRSIVTFILSRTVHALLDVFISKVKLHCGSNILGFLGPRAPIFLPKSIRLPTGTSLRQNTHFELSTTRIGFSVRAVREPEKVKIKKKSKKKGQDPYISRMRGGGALRGRKMVLGTSSEPQEVIIYANLCVYQISSFGAAGGQS